jgi:hypothetical protein
MGVLFNDFFPLDLYGERSRHGFTMEELVALKKLYAESGGRPTVLERKNLMARFGLSKEKVFQWFQNRRSREKNGQLK